MLKEIGLTPDEEELYRSLVRANTARAGELAQRPGWPRAEVVARLDVLRDKGLVLPTGPEPDAPLRPLAPLGEALLRRQSAPTCTTGWRPGRRKPRRPARVPPLPPAAALRPVGPAGIDARPDTACRSARRGRLRRSGVPAVAAPTTPWPSPRQVGRIREAAGLTAAPGLTSSRPVHSP
ncbi:MULTISPECIES: helix-turn-helix domain-containing protein [unclassified Micromonospora]|uniref:helix-turn-helix domain-containing protein n=1 Tax=unclassified Micromonospora TaxID=2617518 RepID=UPI00259C8288|nr:MULTISPECIES: helix-turn-helix domain-containing protein [unclassified Micromonospora]MDM4779723.1 helix-turn-helix domain-containing protein [Micromonospora sp. b486]